MDTGDLTTTTTRVSLESLPASTLIRAQTDMQQTMEQKFRCIDSTQNIILQETEHSLQTVNNDISELSHWLEDLSLENEKLEKKLQKQWSRPDYMENLSRRRNILFHNMPKKRQNETWEDCERVVRGVIKDWKSVQTYSSIVHTVWDHRSSSVYRTTKTKP